MKHCLIIALLFCFSLGVSAQSSDSRVSMESERAAKTKVATNFSLGGNYWTGNTEKGTIIGSLNIAATDSLKEFSFDAKYTYGENNNKLNQREFLTGLQYDYRPLSVFSPYVRIELYTNEFKNIKQRYSGLAGAKYRFFVYRKNGETTSDYSISGAFSYVFEKYTQDAHSSDRQKVRLSLRPKIKQKLAKNIYFQSELFYMPKIDYWEDYIFCVRSNVNFLVNSNIFIKCSYEYDYESKPITTNIKKTDTTLSISLGITI